MWGETTVLLGWDLDLCRSNCTSVAPSPKDAWFLPLCVFQCVFLSLHISVYVFQSLSKPLLARPLSISARFLAKIMRHVYSCFHFYVSTSRAEHFSFSQRVNVQVGARCYSAAPLIWPQKPKTEHNMCRMFVHGSLETYLDLIQFSFSNTWILRT